MKEKKRVPPASVPPTSTSLHPRIVTRRDVDLPSPSTCGTGLRGRCRAHTHVCACICQGARVRLRVMDEII